MSQVHFDSVEEAVQLFGCAAAAAATVAINN